MAHRDEEETTTTTTAPQTAEESLANDELSGYDIPETEEEALARSQQEARDRDEATIASNTARKERELEQRGVPLGGKGWGDLAYPTLPLGEDQFGNLDDYNERLNMFAGEQKLTEEDFKVRPRYSVDYAQYTLNLMSSQELADLEDQLYAAGFISDEPLDSPAARSVGLLTGFGRLILESDMSRNKWEDHLEWSIEQEASRKEKDASSRRKSWVEANPFIAPGQDLPDYATLSQNVKASVRQALGRDATSSEMKMLTQFMSTENKNAWEANELAPARKSWEARARAAETQQPQTVGTTQSVDPNARFAEYFQDRFKGELDFRKTGEQTREQQGSLFGSLDTMSRMMG